jgi:hypothetical protein
MATNPPASILYRKSYNMRHRHICRHYLAFAATLAPTSIPALDRKGIIDKYIGF